VSKNNPDVIFEKKKLNFSPKNKDLPKFMEIEKKFSIKNLRQALTARGSIL